LSVRSSRMYFLLVALLVIIVLSLTTSCFLRDSSEKEIVDDPDLANGIAVPYHMPFPPLDIVLLIDQSSSMSGYGDFPPTDPDEWRVEASKYMVSNIAAKRTPDSIPRFGVVHFGTEAPRDLTVPLTAIESDANLNEINRGIQPLDLNWTSFIAAFQEAIQLFNEGNTFELNRKAVLIVLTDGEPSDPRRLSAEQYFEEISVLVKENFVGNNVDLFIIGIDAADMSWSNYYEQWRRILPTENSALFDLQDMDGLARIYNDIVRMLYREIPDVEEVEISEAEEIEFEIPAYLEWVEFHVFPDTPGLILSIIRPDGSIISENDSDVNIDYGETYSIFMVIAPEPGTWRYLIQDGRGTIKIYRNMVPVKLRILQPPAKVILGTEKEIKLEFSRQDDIPVERHPDYPIQIELLIEGPALPKEALIMEQVGEGLYIVDKLFSPTEAGTHKLIMEVEAAGAFSYTDEFVIDVIKVPYMEAVTPQPGQEINAGSDLKVEVELLEAFEPIELTEYFSTRETALVITWFKSVGKEESEALYLHPTGEKGRLAYTLPYQVARGHNQLRFRVVGDLVSGEPYLGEDFVISFYGVVPWWIKAWPWAAGFLGIVLIILLIMYIRRPSWSGVLEIENTVNPDASPEPVNLFQYGKKKHLILGKKGDIKLTDPDYPNINIRIKPCTQEIDDYGELVKCNAINVFYQISASESEQSMVLANNNQVKIGPYNVIYYEQ
jgi:hypothetical protein